MVKSMTGYGKAESSGDNVSVIVEIKSVNSRYLDFTPKTPRMLMPFDDELVRSIKEKCERGRITLVSTIEFIGESNGFLKLDKEKLEHYVDVANNIQSVIGTEQHLTVDQVLRNPDLFIAEDKSDLENELKSVFFEAVDGALDNLNSIRDAEGLNLKNDLEQRIQSIETIMNEVENVSQGQRKTDFERYQTRIRELLRDVSVDEQRLLQEVAIIAEKKDIAEELTRLKSHIQLYKTYFKDGNNAGKKMNFLLQEMGREVNTIGSKTDHIEVSHLVVSIKEELEKIREQVQNIL